jgi:hypothetical protein
MSHNRDLRNLTHLMDLRSRLQQRLNRNYNAMSQNQRGNLAVRIAHGETAIRRKALQIAQRHGLRINTGTNVNRITTRLITQLIMLRGGLPRNLVNAHT